MLRPVDERFSLQFAVKTDGILAAWVGEATVRAVTSQPRDLHHSP